MKQKLKKQNGITLIALVITIVVLLILAGVSIAMLTGENGILTQANKAKLETRRGACEEEVQLWKTEVNMSKYEEVNSAYKTEEEMLQDLIKKELTFENEIDRNNKTITIGDRVINYAIESNGNKNNHYDGLEVVPTDTKYFTYVFDEETKTAEISGIKPEYAILGYYNGDATIGVYANVGIKDGEKIISDIVVPYEVEKDNVIYKIVKIQENTFKGVSGEKNYYFESFVIPDTITELVGWQFQYTKAKKIIICEGVKRIGKYAFHEAVSLNNINIPKSVINIKYDAFYGCDKLTTVNYAGTEEQWNKIEIEWDNEALEKAQINFNAKQ